VRLRFLQHMVSCCCGGQGDGERQRGTMCTVRRELLVLPYLIDEARSNKNQVSKTPIV